MISLLTSLVLATPVLAPGVVTGKVEVQTVYCITAPCPPMVSLVTADGQRFSVQGPMLRDIEAFKGKYVTVSGEVDARGSVKPDSFAPGKSDKFIMGEVVDMTDCPPNAVCAPRVGIKTPNGEVVEVDDPKMAMDLSGLVGATVMLRGTYDVKELCPMCMGGPMVFVPFKSSGVMVKGNLGPIYHTMVVREPGYEYADYALTLPTGGFLPVYAKNKKWSNVMERDVWVSGKFDAGKFRATNVSRPVVPDPVICFPFGPNGAEGTNVARNSDTDGGVAAGSSSGAGTATTSAGTKR